MTCWDRTLCGMRPNFKQSPRRDAKQIGPEYTLRPRSPVVAVAWPARLSVPIPKQAVIQHAAYMDAVRSLPCAGCGKPPRSQFAHSDAGKGMGIKTDCRLGWPGCADCHYHVGSTGKLGKAGRRKFEEEAAQRTRDEIRKLGLWPASLPTWEGDDDADSQVV